MASPVPMEPIAEEEAGSAMADDLLNSTAKDPFSGPERKRERRSRVDVLIQFLNFIFKCCYCCIVFKKLFLFCRTRSYFFVLFCSWNSCGYGLEDNR